MEESKNDDNSDICEERTKYKQENSNQYHKSDQVVQFIKTKICKDETILQFLSENRLNILNKRNEDISLKSDICVSSVWSALLINNLKDVLQTRFIIEDSIILLQKYLNTTTESQNSWQLRQNLQNAYDTLIDSIRKFNNIEQFLEISIKCEKDIETFSSDDIFSSKEKDKDVLKTEINPIDDDYYDEYFGEVETKPGDDFINDENLVNEIKVEASEEKLFEETFIMSELQEEKVTQPHHTKGTKKKSENKNDNDKARYDCQHCGQSFLNKRNLVVHNRKLAGKCKNLYICSFCNKTYKNKRPYEIHVEMHTTDLYLKKHPVADHHIKSSPSIGQDLNFDQVTPGLDLEKHIGDLKMKKKSRSADGKKFNCDQCGQLFMHESNLNAHIKKHLGEYSFKCTICSKQFVYKGQYDLHMQKHAGIKPFRCHVCAAGFAQKNILDDHIRIHTGEKPFKCEHCPLEFAQKSNMKKHMTIHTGVRPFKCETCMKAFRTKISWIEHQTVHSDARDFKCDLCNKEYKTKSKLRAHVRKTHNMKPDSNTTITQQTS